MAARQTCLTAADKLNGHLAALRFIPAERRLMRRSPLFSVPICACLAEVGRFRHVA